MAPGPPTPPPKWGTKPEHGQPRTLGTIKPALPPPRTERATLSTCAAQSRSRASRKEKTCSSSWSPSRGSISPRRPGPLHPPRRLQAKPTAPHRACAELTRPRPSRRAPASLGPSRPSHRASAPQARPRPPHRATAPASQTPPIPPRFRHEGQIPPIPQAKPSQPATLPAKPKHTAPRSRHSRQNPTRPTVLPVVLPHPSRRTSAPQVEPRPLHFRPADSARSAPAGLSHPVAARQRSS